MSSKFMVVFILGVIFNVAACYAQNSDTLTTTMDEITIESTYSDVSLSNAPFAVTRLNRSAAEINQTPGLTLSEITKTIPGIWVNQRENFALGERITIRGMGWRAAFGVRGIQVVMDGIPLTVADGQSMLDVVEPSMIQSMEVLRGPASTLYGNSSGGVLYIKTIPPVDSNIRYRSQAGSFGLTKNELQINQKIGDHFITGYSSIHNESGFRNHSAVTLSRTAINSRLFLSERSVLQVNSALSVMPRAKNPGSLSREQFLDNAASARSNFKEADAGKQVTQGQLGLRWLLDVNRQSSLETSVYGILRDLRNPLPFAFIDLNRKAGGFRSLYRKNLHNWQWVAGTDMKFQFDDRKNFNTEDGNRGENIQLDQDERVLNEAIFGKLIFKNKQWRFSAGLRFDALQFNNDDNLLSNGDQSGDKTFISFNPSFGINYSFDAHTLFTNFSTSFEAPTTTELVNNPENFGGFNPRINPEKTKSIEAGIRGSLNFLNLHYDVALYSMWTDDLLLPFQIEGTDRTFFRNEGASRNNGAEFVANYRINKYLSGLINYNWNFAKFRSGVLNGALLKSNRIPGVSPHRFLSEWTFQKNIFHITGTVEFTDGYFPDSQNTLSIQSYTLVHLKTSLNDIQIFKNMEATPFFTLRNLTDQSFASSVSVNAFGNRFFEPGADLNFQAGIALHFN